MRMVIEGEEPAIPCREKGYDWGGAGLASPEKIVEIARGMPPAP